MEQYDNAIGRDRIALGILPDNDGARRLYERLGYRDWGHGPIYSDVLEEQPDGRLVRRENAEEILVMVKNLKSSATPSPDNQMPALAGVSESATGGESNSQSGGDDDGEPARSVS